MWINLLHANLASMLKAHSAIILRVYCSYSLCLSSGPMVQQYCFQRGPKGIHIRSVEHENLAALKFSVLKMWINLLHANLAIMLKAHSAIILQVYLVHFNVANLLLLLNLSAHQIFLFYGIHLEFKSQAKSCVQMDAPRQ